MQAGTIGLLYPYIVSLIAEFRVNVHWLLLPGSLLAAGFATQQAFCIGRLASTSAVSRWRSDLLVHAAWLLAAAVLVIAGWLGLWNEGGFRVNGPLLFASEFGWMEDFGARPITLVCLGLLGALHGIRPPAELPFQLQPIALRRLPHTFSGGFALFAVIAGCFPGGLVYWLSAIGVRAIEFADRPELTDEIFVGRDWADHVAAGGGFFWLSVLAFPLLFVLWRNLARPAVCLLAIVLLGLICATARFHVLPRFCPAMVETDFGIWHLVDAAPLMLPLLVTAVALRTESRDGDATLIVGGRGFRVADHLKTAALACVALAMPLVIFVSVFGTQLPSFDQFASGRSAMLAARMMLHPIRLLLLAVCLTAATRLFTRFRLRPWPAAIRVWTLRPRRFVALWLISAAAVIVSLCTFAWASVGAWWLVCRG